MSDSDLCMCGHERGIHKPDGFHAERCHAAECGCCELRPLGENLDKAPQWVRERAVEVVTDAVVENCGVDGFAVLDSAFGNYPWPWLDVENSIVDMDFQRARDELVNWKSHLRRHGHLAVDHRVATDMIARAEVRLAALATTRPTCSRLVSVEHGQRPDSGDYLKYTMKVWRERTRKARASQ